MGSTVLDKEAWTLYVLTLVFCAGEGEGGGALHDKYVSDCWPRAHVHVNRADSRKLNCTLSQIVATFTAHVSPRPIFSLDPAGGGGGGEEKVC